MRATDEPVVPCKLLLDTGPYSHGLRHQVLANPFHICGAEEAHVMYVWVSRIGRLRLTIPLYPPLLWRTRPQHVPYTTPRRLGLKKRRREAPITRGEHDTIQRHAPVHQGKLLCVLLHDWAPSMKFVPTPVPFLFSRFFRPARQLQRGRSRSTGHVATCVGCS